MAERDFETMLKRLRALGDQSRLNLVGILSRGEQPVDELARLLQLKAPTVSHHLGVLKEAGLAAVRPEGTVRYYRLDRKGLTSVAKALRTPSALADLTESTELECWERRVLANFMDGRQLKEIPASRKKREVILRWLASRFDEGRDYPESEVNEILLGHHEDCATLRRELIGLRLMTRAKSIYRRT
jgi:hypothetical protein